jgi:hypothetical protein
MNRIIGGLLFLVAATAWGQFLDPANLHIGTGAGTGACSVGCAGDPNLLKFSDDFSVANVDNSTTLSEPLLVILGIPNYSGIAPKMTAVTTYGSNGGQTTTAGGTSLAAANFGIATADYFGGTWATNGGSAAMAAFPESTPDSTDAYSLLGIGGAGVDNSNHEDNWFDGAAEIAAFGVEPASFGLYVYQINAAIVNKGLFDIQWGAALPAGTIAIAYGCQLVTNPTDVCPSGGGTHNPFVTAFTESGLVGPGSSCLNCGQGGQVPEPGTMVLLGSGLLIAFTTLRKKLARP